MSDPSLPRPRREIIRLQGIRRMLEDLQSQIRELQAVANDRPSDVITPEPMRSISSGPSLRPYQEHMRRQHQRDAATSVTNTPDPDTQLLSLLRATVRTMRMSSDLSTGTQRTSVSTPSPPASASPNITQVHKHKNSFLNIKC